TTITIDGVQRQADGRVSISPSVKAAGINLKPGEYLAEDKGGSRSFDLDQAKRYNNALSSVPKGSKPTTDNGKEYDGVIYYFQSEAAAVKALNTLKLDNVNLHSDFHIAYYDDAGNLKVER
ncbi:MAG: hypothetical protein J2P37_36925, partial [Ktedonobacteraceae bacterium]|nr:hypothetical protein [Ktedonobacteraceae bacterium]